MLMFEKQQTALTTVGSGRRGVTSVRRIHLLSFGEVSMTLSYNSPFFYLQTLYQLTTLSTEAVSLLQDLQSQSKTFTVFVPVNNAVNSKVTDITVFFSDKNSLNIYPHLR